jgi:hypothetical protein
MHVCKAMALDMISFRNGSKLSKCGYREVSNVAGFRKFTEPRVDWKRVGRPASSWWDDSDGRAVAGYHTTCLLPCYAWQEL